MKINAIFDFIISCCHCLSFDLIWKVQKFVFLFSDLADRHYGARHEVWFGYLFANSQNLSTKSPHERSAEIRGIREAFARLLQHVPRVMRDTPCQPFSDCTAFTFTLCKNWRGILSENSNYTIEETFWFVLRKWE